MVPALSIGDAGVSPPERSLVVAIAASAGGVSALAFLLQALPRA